ncbi:hypothetical protein ACFQ0T_09955 [Kitasatospora gansuensis]
MPAASAAPTTTWRATAPPGARISGASRVSSSTRPQSTWSPARTASSTKPVPGSRTLPSTPWSPIHAWVSIDSLPVSTTPPLSGETTAALSIGWSTASRPAEPRSPKPTPTRSIQYR